MANERAAEARRRGRRAERVALDLYVADGYEVLGTNVRLGSLEVDILARKGGRVAVIEVRTRRAGALVGGFASVTRAKLERLRRARDIVWRRLRSDATVMTVVIDVAVVHLDARQVRVERSFCVG